MLLRRDIVRIAAPLVVQYVSESILYFVDTMFVSWLGKHAIAGVATALYVKFLVQGPITSAFLAAYTTYTAQAWGAGRREVVARSFLTFLSLLALALGLVAIALLYTGAYLIALVFPEEESVRLGYEYLIYTLTAAPGSALFITYLAVLYGAGRTRESAVAWILSDIVNAVLDPVLIYGLNLGVIGAALAFSISIYAALPVLHIYFRKTLGMPLRLVLDKGALRVLRDVGVPVCIERFTSSLLFTAYGAAIGRYGLEVYAAYQIGLRIESFLYMPLLAFADIANIVIGQELGSGQASRTVRTYAAVVLYALLLTICLAALVLALYPLYIGLFTSDERLQSLIWTYLVLAALSDLGLAVEMSGRGAYRAAGRAYLATVLCLVSMTCVRVIPAHILAHMRAPVLYVWMLMIVDTSLRAALLYVGYVKWVSRRPVVYV